MEGKRIQLLKKNSNYESVPRLLCLFLSMCASGLFIFESVWNNFFFKNKISKSNNCSYLPSSWEESALFNFLLFFLVYLYIVIFWCISFQWLNFYLRFGLFQSNNEKKKTNKTKELWIVFCNFFPLFLSLNKELLHWQNPTAVFLRFSRESEYKSSLIWRWGRGVQTQSLYSKQTFDVLKKWLSQITENTDVNLMDFRKDDS